MISLMFVGFTSYRPPRAKPSSCLRQIRPALAPALRSASVARNGGGKDRNSSIIREATPWIPIRRLLKSWAIPPASVPMASIFWAWMQLRLKTLAFRHVDEALQEIIPIRDSHRNHGFQHRDLSSLRIDQDPLRLVNRPTAFGDRTTTDKIGADVSMAELSGHFLL